MYTGGPSAPLWLDSRFPILTQDGRDDDHEPGYILNLTESATCGFRYFDFKGVRRVTVRTRGYATGYFSVKTAWDGPELGRVPVPHSANWRDSTADVALPDGVHALYFTYHGRGATSLLSFTLE